MTPAERVRAALEAHGGHQATRRQGRDWLCPAHDDQQASLSVAEGRDGRAVLHCHAGCSTEDVIARLGLGWADLFPQGPNGKAELVATYDYTDHQGRLLYQCVRYFPKAFKRRRPDGRGGWIWNLKDTPLVLYRLPRVVAAVQAGQPVYLVEGEKDAHAVERAGATATTVLGGVNGIWQPEFSRLLAKTRAVVVADDDDPGRQRARRIAAAIADHGGQVDLAGPAAGKDAADHLAAGLTLADLQPLDQQPQTAPAEDGAALLEEVYGVLERYVVFPSGKAAVAVTLWVAASHAQPAWEHATRLAIKSPVKRYGKSRLLDLLEALCHDPLLTVNISPAALVRTIGESDPPTVLVDETDTVFGKRRGERSDQAEDLRGILNAGHQRGRPYIRWDPAARQAERCPTFAMAALAGIGDLPDTIEDRAVVVTMRRRAPGERVAPLRRRDLPALAELRDRLHAFIRAHLAELEAVIPAMPVEDRAADVWEPLVAVADLAGDGWPGLARDACRTLTTDAAADTESTASERLLADLQAVFGDAGALYTTTLLDRLHKREEAPWADWYGKGLDARGLARLLRPYGVRSKSVREGGTGEALKGYAVEDLHDVWRRYLPSATQPTHPAHDAESAGQGCVGNVSDDRARSDTRADQPERGYVSLVSDVTDTPPGDGRLPGVDSDDPGRFTR